MSEIIETRTLRISSRIIRSHEIRRLFTDIENEINRLDGITDEEIERILADEKYKKYDVKEKEREKRLLKKWISKRLKVKAIDNSVYEGHSNEILANGGILDSKQVISIDFDFTDSNHNLSIAISLHHSSSDLRNEVRVQGADSIWVNGIIKKIEIFLDSLEPQSTWARKYSFLLTLFFGICISIVASEILINIIFFLGRDFPLDPTSPKLSVRTARGIIFIMMLGLSTYPAMTLTDKIKELWPLVELQTGQDYNQAERQKRRNVWLIFSLVILPTILTILTELIGS
ncbi:MAG: hypothetical protein U0U09_04990 [Cyclobacteriaceae bacterium]